MKPSELIKQFIEVLHEPNHNYNEEQTAEAVKDFRDEILDQMAEDIKYLKDNMNNPFPYCIPKPIKREWEKEVEHGTKTD